MNKILKLVVPTIVAFAALASATGALAASGGGGVPGPNNLFITSAVEHPGGTVTLPLHRGVSNGQTVYYLITDVSDGNLAAKLLQRRPNVRILFQNSMSHNGDSVVRREIMLVVM